MTQHKHRFKMTARVKMNQQMYYRFTCKLCGIYIHVSRQEIWRRMGLFD